MKLGFVTAILPDLTLQEVLKFAAKEHFDCIEPMCWPVGKAERRYAGVTHIDVSKMDAGAARKVQDLCTEAGVSLSGLGYYPNVLSANAAEARACTEHLKRVILAAETLGVNLVNTFIGRDPARSVDDNWPAFLKTWKPLIKLAEDHGVRVAIENCPMFFSGDEWPGGKNLAASPAIWRRMFEAIPSPNFGLNFDPSHLVWQHMDYKKPLKEFSDRIFHVHAKDAELDQSRLDEVGILATPLEYHTPRIPGRGGIDWRAFVSALTQSGYDGPVCIEVEDRDFEKSLQTRKEALQISGKFMRQMVSAPTVRRRLAAVR